MSQIREDGVSPFSTSLPSTEYEYLTGACMKVDFLR
jgi:hypothetical protein